MNSAPNIQSSNLTLDDYLQTPAGPPWFELIEGRLIQEPSPTSDHQSIALELMLSLGTYLKAHSIGRLLPAPMDVYLGPTNVLQPDIAIVLKHRENLITRRAIEGPPDLVVEILSPSNWKLDCGPKRSIYERAGVRVLWIVDPKGRTIDSYRFAASGSAAPEIQTWRDGDTITEPILPEFSVPVAEIFQHLR